MRPRNIGVVLVLCACLVVVSAACGSARFRSCGNLDARTEIQATSSTPCGFAKTAMTKVVQVVEISEVAPDGLVVDGVKLKCKLYSAGYKPYVRGSVALECQGPARDVRLVRE